MNIAHATIRLMTSWRVRGVIADLYDGYAPESAHAYAATVYRSDRLWDPSRSRYLRHGGLSTRRRMTWVIAG